MRGWPVLALLLPACALAVPTPTPVRQPTPSVAAPPAPATVTVALPTTVQIGPTFVATRAVAVATTSPTPTDPGHGVVFGRPTALVSGNNRQIGVLVTNRGDMVKSFLVLGAYTEGERIVATASGTVNDLLPGQTRAVLLLATTAPPASTAGFRLGIEAMSEHPSTAASRVAPLVRFGPPTVAGGQQPRIDALVRNDDAAPHSFLAQAAVMSGDDLVGVGTAAVNDLAPGETRPAAFLVRGAIEAHDRVLLAIETLGH